MEDYVRNLNLFEWISNKSRPLIDIRDDAPADLLAVRVPILAVFLVALLLVAELAVNKQDSKVDGIKVWQGARET